MFALDLERSVDVRLLDRPAVVRHELGEVRPGLVDAPDVHVRPAARGVTAGHDHDGLMVGRVLRNEVLGRKLEELVRVRIGRPVLGARHDVGVVLVTRRVVAEAPVWDGYAHLVGVTLEVQATEARPPLLKRLPVSLG